MADKWQDDPRTVDLLRIARAARDVGDLGFAFQMKLVPTQALGGLTPERTESISQDFHVALQALLDSFCGVNLDNPATLRYADDPRQPSA